MVEEIINIEKHHNQISENDFSIYPNPANGFIQLLATGDKEQVSYLEIVNIIGERIYSSESYQSNIDLTDQKAGIYFVRLNINGKMVTKRIVIISNTGKD